jgi:hypothetical protein
MRHLVLVVVLLLVACGGGSANRAATATPGAFNASGLKLVIGVERTKTLEVHPDGTIVSSETGHPIMTFVGTDLRSLDGSKTILSLSGDELRGATKTVGTFQGELLTLGDLRLWVEDDGTVKMQHDGDHKMRMHFDGSVVGQKRPALMLVALVFALYIATNPTATLDRFVD